jgi:hypothetical protein
MFTGNAVKESITPKNNRLVRRSYVDAVAAELHVIMDNVIERISQYYRVHPLSTVERIPVDNPDLPTQPIYYSEPMEFFSYLLNLRDEEIPLPKPVSITVCNRPAYLLASMHLKQKLMTAKNALLPFYP